MKGFHLEPLLAGAYILLLITIALALEWMARHTHKRADQYYTGGFRFDRDRDTWEYPTGMALQRAEVDYELRVIRYRAPAHTCNPCPVKMTLHPFRPGPRDPGADGSVGQFRLAAITNRHFACNAHARSIHCNR